MKARGSTSLVADTAHAGPFNDETRAFESLDIDVGTWKRGEENEEHCRMKEDGIPVKKKEE